MKLPQLTLLPLVAEADAPWAPILQPILWAMYLGVAIVCLYALWLFFKNFDKNISKGDGP